MFVKVGVRELRDNLRSYLDRVKEGHEVIVTERGTTVARILAPESDEQLHARLVREGTITPAKHPKEPIDVSKLPDLGPGPSLSDIVIAMRRGGEF
ncbi:MAG: type II toxin-antitoxin system prevent-host-death family antitoxin [Actinobacteria bacterium]|nr:type II toxin-antitoxin system prevent-host-death family antitoxin [Actinomycetota bacterium]